MLKFPLLRLVIYIPITFYAYFLYLLTFHLHLYFQYIQHVQGRSTG